MKQIFFFSSTLMRNFFNLIKRQLRQLELTLSPAFLYNVHLADLFIRSDLPSTYRFSSKKRRSPINAAI